MDRRSVGAICRSNLHGSIVPNGLLTAILHCVVARGREGTKRWRGPTATFLVLLAMAFAVAGNAAVATAAVGEITEFSDGLSQDNGPRAITPGPDGNLWFTNPGNSDTQSIGRITTAGAITEFRKGIGDIFIESLARGPDGNLWFTNPTKAINRITPTGELTEFTDGPRPELRPFSIVRGADGNLWFTVQGGEPRAIGRITPEGEITEYLYGLNPGSFPYGIAAGSDGNVWFTDVGTTPAIGRITPSGGITEFSEGLSAGSTIERIAPGPDGNLWFTNRGVTKAIGRITPSGDITEFSDGLGPNSNPRGITPGPDGNMWFTDRGTVDGTRAIGRITTSGQITMFSVGLNAIAFPQLITVGADGNVWFTDSGSTSAIGRVETGAPAAVEEPPSIDGVPEPGGSLRCDGEQWATWSGEDPVPNAAGDAPPPVQWLRDGVAIPEATERTYTLGPADRGHSIGCAVAAIYPLLDVVATAASDTVSLPPAPPDPEPPTGPEDPTQPADPSDPPGLANQPPPAPALHPTAPAATLGCKRAGRKVICTLELSAAEAISRVRLSRHGITYASGKPTRRGRRLLLRFHLTQPLPRGRYALTIVRRLESQSIVRRQTVVLSR
jgi:streptogramin lyase